MKKANIIICFLSSAGNSLQRFVFINLEVMAAVSFQLVIEKYIKLTADGI